MQDKSIFANKKHFIILFLLISLLIAGGGYFYYVSEERSIRNQQEMLLSTIAESKIKQISDWYEDEIHDALVIAKSKFLTEKITGFLNDNDTRSKSSLTEFLSQIKIEHDYKAILLVSTDGEVLISTDEKFSKTNLHQTNTIREAISNEISLSSDLYRNNSNKKIYIDFIAPVIVNGPAVAALVFTMDPNDFLYPLVEGWPVKSQTAETFIFRIDNDSITYLSELRHKKNSALEHRLPITNNELAAVRAALGYSGILSGKDYRSADIFAYVGQVPGTEWFAVSKIDKSEMLERLEFRTVVIIVITTLIISLFALGLSFLYSFRQRNIFRELYTKEKELWQEQEKFKTTLDSIGDGVITTDIDGKILYMNRIAEQLTGWNLREARGRNLDDVYSIKNEFTGLNETNITEKVLKIGIVKELANHTLLVSKSGKEIPVMDTGAPIRDKEGKVLGVVLVFEDETEKRNQLRLIKESEERLRSTLDNMLEGCQIISKDWRYLYVNDTAAKHGRTTKEKLIGNSMPDVYPGIENTEVFRVLKSCMSDRTTALLENEFTFPDGSKGWFELSIQPVDESVFILSQDITERKRAEMEIIKAKDKAEELNRIKSSFFANMSHELRTPLVGILGFADIMKDLVKNNNELSEMTDFIKQAGMRLLNTLNLVLNISKLEADRTELNLKNTNIIPLIKESVKLYSAEALKKKLEYNFIFDSDEVICLVDENLFVTVINNLINNALKYTDKGKITIQTETASGKVQINVIDTGIGISKEKQKLIWEEFRQASEGLSRKYEGTGLGLTIVKKYTELMGGKISLESKEGMGSAFAVTFDISKERITEKPPGSVIKEDDIIPAENVSSGNRKAILYIEDDDISQKFVAMILKDRYDLQAAAAAEDALVMVKQNRYDLILMDINLQTELNGLELTRLIRKFPGYGNIPIIAVTAYAMSGDKEEFISEGMTDYIAKPFRKYELINKIDRLLRV